MNKTWQVVLAFCGIFVAGAVAGVFVAPKIWQCIAERRGLEQFTAQKLKHLTDQLKLTPEQQKNIQPILARAAEEFQVLRKDNNRVGERLEAEIKSQLTAEQRAEYVEIANRRNERERLWQKWVKEQRTKAEQEGRIPSDLPPPPATTTPATATTNK